MPPTSARAMRATFTRSGDERRHGSHQRHGERGGLAPGQPDGHGHEWHRLDHQSGRAHGHPQRRSGPRGNLSAVDVDGQRGRQRPGQRDQHGHGFRRRRDEHLQRHGQRPHHDHSTGRPDLDRDPCRQLQPGRRGRHLHAHGDATPVRAHQRHGERGGPAPGRPDGHGLERHGLDAPISARSRPAAATSWPRA